MKKILIVIFAAAASLLSISCEENFNPKEEFKQKYVLWCIVNSDYRYENAPQFAVLAKTYDVDGFDPAANRVDPVLKDADVRLYADDVEYKFVQDTTNRRDTTRYDSTFIYYRSTPVKLRFGSRLYITAKLPTGEVLSAETSLPLNMGLEYSDEFVDYGVSTINRDISNEWSIWWETNGNHLFFPGLKIVYTQQVGENRITKSRKVPLRYINSKPYYPDYSVESEVSFSFDAIDSAMAMISAGDTAKGNYTIQSFVFELIEFDTPLSYYYSSINGYLDNYSIRLDELTYSNINGGLGVFGSTYYISRSFPVSKKYSQMFGYQ